MITAPQHRDVVADGHETAYFNICVRRTKTAYERHAVRVFSDPQLASFSEAFEDHTSIGAGGYAISVKKSRLDSEITFL
jgi:hypothetical protein